MVVMIERKWFKAECFCFYFIDLAAYAEDSENMV